MAFCTKCGNELIDDDRFCRECGAPVFVEPGACEAESENGDGSHDGHASEVAYIDKCPACGEPLGPEDKVCPACDYEVAKIGEFTAAKKHQAVEGAHEASERAKSDVAYERSADKQAGENANFEFGGVVNKVEEASTFLLGMGCLGKFAWLLILMTVLAVVISLFSAISGSYGLLLIVAVLVVLFALKKKS